MSFVPVDAWVEEPVSVPETKFTPHAEKGWSAWNGWSVEVEVADFLPQLAELIGAERVLETGCGQGYVTRRLAPTGPFDTWELVTFESDDELRSRIADFPLWDDQTRLDDKPTPDETDIGQADLIICDSDVKYRIDEIRLWVEHGKPGSFLWTHDTARHHGWLPDTIFKSTVGLPRLQFDNPRGSTLFYKPYDDEQYEPVVEVEGPSGSVFVVQIDGGTVDGAYAHSMIKAVTYTMQFPGLFSGYLRWTGGPLIAKARTEVVKHFLGRTDADWLLMVDSDMVFDPDTIHRLWQNADAQNRPIVAGHCYAMMAERGPIPTMWQAAPEGSPGPLIPFEGYPTNALVPVGATGAACLMVHRSVFEKLQAEMPDHPYPWFEEAYWGNLPVGEDLTFCIRARKAGFPIFVDTSLDIGHVKPQLVNRDWFERWRKSRRFVITGWGRSGTAYIADLLRKVGISCGHEWVYTADGPDWGSRWGDASWMAVPYLDEFDGPIVHLVRDPYKVAESLIGSALFDPDNDSLAPVNTPDFREFVYKHIPGLEQLEDPVDRVVAYMEVWADRIDQFDAPIFRVEEMDAEKLVEIVNMTGRPRPATVADVAAAVEATPTDVNTRPRLVEVDWSQQDEKVRNVLDALRVRYGYEKEGT